VRVCVCVNVGVWVCGYGCVQDRDDLAMEHDTGTARLSAQVEALRTKLANADANCASLRADLDQARRTAAEAKTASDSQAQEFRAASARQVSELQRLLADARAATSQVEADAAAQVARVKQSKAEELSRVRVDVCCIVLYCVVLFCIVLCCVVLCCVEGSVIWGCVLMEGSDVWRWCLFVGLLALHRYLRVFALRLANATR